MVGVPRAAADSASGEGGAVGASAMGDGGAGTGVGYMLTIVSSSDGQRTSRAGWNEKLLTRAAFLVSSNELGVILCGILGKRAGVFGSGEFHRARRWATPVQVVPGALASLHAVRANAHAARRRGA
mmetsp:Transcript_4072/g.12723  ORF Transcript_4072/g.12723 Transcript_4072/m.12723 type:complete len:126 (-) Transcript_4072:870-1247(-)